MSVPEITAREAHAQLDTFHPVDVREEHEFHGPLGRLPGARWIPLGALEERLRELPKDRPILVVCRSGARSAKACTRLREAGFDATNLAGGMIAWNRAELPIEETRPRFLVELRDAIVAWLAQVTRRPPSAVADELRAWLSQSDASFEDPTQAALDWLLDLSEASLDAAELPPDLDLTLATFRRWLAVS